MGGHRAFGAGDDLVDGPVDLAAVRADDALLDAIAGGTVSGGVDAGDVFGRPGQDDDHLAAILAAWKADIEAEPMPELVSLDEAAEAVEAGHAARDRRASRARRRMPFAVAAAAIAVALSGFTVAVHSAQPGDAMFGLTKVFFSQHADNVAKAEQARATIVEANNAIARGDRATAQSLLQSAGTQIQAVQPEDQPALVQQRQDALKSLDPAATGPTPSTGTSEPAQQAPGEESGTRPKPQRPAPQDPAEASTTASVPSTDGSTSEPDTVTPEQGREATTTTPPAPSPSGN
ncbi:anti-sigma-D factor RsdA [Actinomycetospora sp. OC33-EN08]|uniref:Anti-sigma-D factor RsdA n=1 Tax=Actinomycetospora aurantiaca TaxID=3129233 RepID=A0ABU8MMU1_9PSEU